MQFLSDKRHPNKFIEKHFFGDNPENFLRLCYIFNKNKTKI